MGDAEERRWKVGELARATGVTVRALHHYDELGLLVPSHRTFAGHRLYAEADVTRLYRILALRQLGLPLNEIAGLLDDDAPNLTATVRRHLARLERELDQGRRLRARLVRMLESLERSVQPSAEHFIDAMEAMTVIPASVDVVMHVPYEPERSGEKGRRLKSRHRGQKIALLKEREGTRVLPIWIGADEGFALVLGLCGQSTQRPLTPDLATRLIELAGQRVERVVVERLSEGTYYATVTVAHADDVHELDSRPSDAFNLAARLGAPVFVTPEVMDEHAARYPDELQARLDDGRAKAPGPDGESAGEWRSLTQDLMRSLEGGASAE